MTRNESLLMSSSELYLMVAASGAESFLSFKPEAIPDRAQQIHAVSRLINEGFLIQSAKGLIPGPSVCHYLDIIANAPTAVVVKTGSEEAPPHCIYSSDWERELACIVPYDNRLDTYKIYTTTVGELLDEFEAMHILPDVMGRAETYAVEEKEDGFEERVSDLLKLANIETNDFANEGIIFSIFRKYQLKDKVHVSTMKVLSDTITNAIVIQDDVIAQYSRENIVSWLRGLCNDSC